MNVNDEITPSIFILFKYFILTGIGFLIHPIAFVIVLVILFWNLWVINVNVYTFEEGAFKEKKGVLINTEREIPYFKIKSVMIERPLWYSLFGMYRVKITSSDPYATEMILDGVNDGDDIAEYLRHFAQVDRSNRGIKEYDVYNL